MKTSEVPLASSPSPRLRGEGIGGLWPPFLIEERRCEASAMVRGTLHALGLAESPPHPDPNARAKSIQRYRALIPRHRQRDHGAQRHPAKMLTPHRKSVGERGEREHGGERGDDPVP